MNGPNGSNETRHVAGRLEGIELTEVIRCLGQRRKTGILDVRQSAFEKQLYFQDGRVVFAASSDPNDRLGETLLRHGAVTVSELELALRNLGTGKRIGTLMVDAGVLTPQELHAAVLEQIKTIFLDLLTWDHAGYDFAEGPLPSDESITLQLASDELLLQGIRSIRSGERVAQSAGPPRTTYVLADGWRARVDGLNLTLGERLVLQRLTDCEQSIAALCREVSLSSFEVQRTLWAFKLLGLAEVSETAPAADGEGCLSSTPFFELILRLCGGTETGVLYLHHGERARSFHFSSGRCVFATSNDPDDGLVALLYRKGVISLTDREETTRRMLSNKRVGTILREMGVIDDQDLQEAVRHQIAEIVFSTFTWEEGAFTFVRGPLPSIEETPLNLGMARILSEGVRRIGSWTRVLQGCGGLDNPLCLTPEYLDVLDDMAAGVAEWEVVSTIKQPQTPRRVCNQCELSDFRICQILWTLKLLGGLEDSPVEMDDALIDGAAQMGRYASVAEEAVGLDDDDEEEPEPVEADSPPAATAEPLNEPETESEDTPEAGETPMAAAEEVEPESSETVDEPAAAPEEVRAETLRLEPEDEMSEPETMAAATVKEDVASIEQEIELQIEPPAEGWSAECRTEEPATSDDGGGDLEAASGDDDDDDEIIEADLPDGIDEIIYRFNAMHRIVYRAVRAEVGAGAANFVRSCCIRIGENATDPVEGVALHSDGSWDESGLKKVISRKGLSDPWQFYQLVLDTEFSSLEPHLGSARAEELKQKIWEIEQAGVAS